MPEQPTHADLQREIERLDEAVGGLYRRINDQWKWFLGTVVVIVLALIGGMWQIIATIRDVEQGVIDRQAKVREELKAEVGARLDLGLARTDSLLTDMVEVVAHNREELAGLKRLAEMNEKRADEVNENSRERMNNHIERQHR